MTSLVDQGIDLDAYCRRIAYDGARDASISTLRQLQHLHPMAIPFENLDPYLHRPVKLDVASLFHKLVNSRRGGYCFEQNLLFGHVLRALGFQVRGLAARVMWNKPEEDITPRGHMVLHVEAEGRSRICDVGFGVMTLTAPLELVRHKEQPTPHEVYRLVPMDGDYKLESFIDDQWRPLYRFGLEEHHECDYEVTNYYLSTRDVSHFRTTLMAARAWPGGRSTISNRDLKIRRLDGSLERRELASPEEVAEVLGTEFLIEISDMKALEMAMLREGVFAPEQALTYKGT